MNVWKSFTFCTTIIYWAPVVTLVALRQFISQFNFSVRFGNLFPHWIVKVLHMCGKVTWVEIPSCWMPWFSESFPGVSINLATVKKVYLKLGMVACPFNPGSQRQRQENVCQFKTNLTCIVSSRSASACGWRDGSTVKLLLVLQKIIVQFLVPTWGGS